VVSMNCARRTLGSAFVEGLLGPDRHFERWPIWSLVRADVSCGRVTGGPIWPLNRAQPGRWPLRDRQRRTIHRRGRRRRWACRQFGGDGRSLSAWQGWTIARSRCRQFVVPRKRREGTRQHSPFSLRTVHDRRSGSRYPPRRCTVPRDDPGAEPPGVSWLSSAAQIQLTLSPQLS
jgi:hypothetical protein